MRRRTDPSAVRARLRELRRRALEAQLAGHAPALLPVPPPDARPLKHWADDPDDDREGEAVHSSSPEGRSLTWTT